MKKKIITPILLTFLFSTIFATILKAQKNSSSIILNGMMTHFPGSGENPGEPGMYNYPIDPGIELLYQFSFSPKFNLSTGVNYQLGRISTYIQTVDRYRFEELSIPIIFRTAFLSEKKHYLFISAGVSSGKMIHNEWERKGSGSSWLKILNKEDEEYYSEKYYFTDILLDIGYSFQVSQRNEIAVSPFIKYRVIDNWMSYYRKNLYYGIKISYQLNFTKQ